LILHFVVEKPDFPVSERDIELIFGPTGPLDKVIKVQTDDLASMAVEAGLFPSKGQSRKNGLHGPAPHGLHQIGTKKRRFWVWNPKSSDDKVTFSLTFDRTQGWFK
jgi:hypothetical protein